MKRKFLFFWIALIILFSGVIYGFNYKKTNKSKTGKAATATSKGIKNSTKKSHCALWQECSSKSAVDCPSSAGTPTASVEK